MATDNTNLNFLIQFEVLSAGKVSGETKDHRTWERARLIGFAVDGFGTKVMCTADLAYGGKMQFEPKSGDHVVLTLSSMSMRSALLELAFSDCVASSSQAPRELKPVNVK